jgi:hypothetical protein
MKSKLQKELLEKDLKVAVPVEIGFAYECAIWAQSVEGDRWQDGRQYSEF